jgi:hypothetical protein
MAETLRQKQSRFVRGVALLIQYATQTGYEVTFSEAYRSPEQAKRNAASGTGIANSLHCDRLAIDLNLFRDGRYLSSTEAHRPLGEFWESLGDDYCWGGRFKDSQGRPRPDGNHYSIAYGGRK